MRDSWERRISALPLHCWIWYEIIFKYVTGYIHSQYRWHLLPHTRGWMVMRNIPFCLNYWKHSRASRPKHLLQRNTRPPHRPEWNPCPHMELSGERKTIIELLTQNMGGKLARLKGKCCWEKWAGMEGWEICCASATLRQPSAPQHRPVGWNRNLRNRQLRQRHQRTTCQQQEVLCSSKLNGTQIWNVKHLEC